MDNFDWIPKGYYMDESEPELLVLRRDDGLRLAFFPPERATRAAILQTIVKVREWESMFEG